MTKFKPIACGFHSHSDYSLDGGSTAESRIKRAAQLDRVADCLTDHGIMSGLIPHYMAAQKLYKDKKISKPIISIHGIEAYLIDENRPWKDTKNGTKEPRYYHVTVHFKDKWAYEYFCKLTPIMESRAVVKYGERKPLLTWAELEGASGHITLGSCCLVGPVQSNVLLGRIDWAEANYLRLRNIAGAGNFFVEVFPHIIDHEWKRPKTKDKKIIEPGSFVPCQQRSDEWTKDAKFEPDPCTGLIDIQKRPNEFVLYLAQKYGDPVIISLDDHYACTEDKVIQEQRMSNGLESWRFYGNYHSKTSEECAESFRQQLNVPDKDIEEWIDNSYKFVDLFKDYTVSTSKDKWLLPTVETVYGINTPSKDKLMELVEKHGKMPKLDHPRYKEYKDRLDYEISVLTDNGVADFLPYFFVLEDAVNYAKSLNSLVNLRGSGGGSLLTYLLGMSVTDPIVYDLPFERFLSLGRIKSGSLPDLDSDWEDRDFIHNYLLSKYGDKIALIATDLMLRFKSSVLDTSRAEFGRVPEETTRMCKMISPAQQGQSDMEWLFGSTDKTTGAHIPGFLESNDPGAEELRQWKDKNPKLWDIVQRCIGITKTRGVHAGGVVITPESISGNMPLIQSERGLATAYNMKGVEYIGGVKYDFLGVSTLKAIGIALRSIQETTGLKIEWGEFPHDPEVYKNIIEKNALAGIFQLNTNTVRPYVQQVRPQNIEQISALTALIRPGALDAPSPNPNFKGTAAEYYVACSQGREKPYFIHEDLVPILGGTYSIIVFQEQALRIFRDLAGYSFETAEEVRRGIGKKDKALLEKHGLILKTKLMERGWTEKQADTLFDSILASAKYSFNKSHSTSYAIVAYNGCWLKHNYPLHFWKGELSINTGDKETIQEYLKECGHLLLGVDILKSHPTEWVIEGNKIRPPLSVIKGCGEKQATMLKSFIDGSVVPDIGDVDDDVE